MRRTNPSIPPTEHVTMMLELGRLLSLPEKVFKASVPRPRDELLIDVSETDGMFPIMTFKKFKSAKEVKKEAAAKAPATKAPAKAPAVDKAAKPAAAGATAAAATATKK